jgi:spore coat-associated protein N
MDDLLNELERDRPDDRGQRDRRRRVATAAVLAGLAFVGIGLSGAVFGDTQTLGTNDFTTGTVRLGTNPTATVVSAGNMAPGDEVFGDVRVDNTGSLQLRYALAATADDPDGKGLNTQLRLSVYSGLTQLQCAAGNVGLGTLEGGPSTLGTPVKVFGDSNQGIDVGDRVLDAGASERLCVRVALPLATGNAYQNATSTITLTFDAEQTANNMTVNP